MEPRNYRENGKPLGEDEDLGEQGTPVCWITVQFTDLEAGFDDSDLIFLLAEKIARRKVLISDTNQYYRARLCISLPIVGYHPDERSMLFSALRQAHFILQGVSDGLVVMNRYYFNGGQ
ncbi:uncharacterized protein N7511_005460 [Penicillium nucicola]|uniref:uncharacterized protein n=1 Tax=Penicillium nucicola TaxID=1850975 RepID=UPI0025450622|nr:uncharacterized protein N7511_005460 [Penicillium nucicola]KAJ5762078.1 hypothetical protein N7511_005460 [Penicillium nucicola]